MRCPNDNANCVPKTAMACSACRRCACPDRYCLAPGTGPKVGGVRTGDVCETRLAAMVEETKAKADRPRTLMVVVEIDGDGKADLPDLVKLAAEITNRLRTAERTGDQATVDDLTHWIDMASESIRVGLSGDPAEAHHPHRAGCVLMPRHVGKCATKGNMVGRNFDGSDHEPCGGSGFYANTSERCHCNQPDVTLTREVIAGPCDGSGIDPDGDMCSGCDWCAPDHPHPELKGAPHPITGLYRNEDRAD